MATDGYDDGHIVGHIDRQIRPRTQEGTHMTTDGYDHGRTCGPVCRQKLTEESLLMTEADGYGHERDRSNTDVRTRDMEINSDTK